MNKPLCIVSAPPDTYSGYGARSRDFIKALYNLKKDEWDIKVISLRWGNTPRNFLADNIEEWGWLLDLVLPVDYMITDANRPAYWFQITVPNEFQPVGSVFSCGVTAGIETTLCDASWIEGVNRMNLTLVSSTHAKKVFESSIFDVRDQNNRVIKQIKLEKPVDVLFEGVDLNKYKLIGVQELDSELKQYLDGIPEDFCYLSVGHWMQGDIGHDRKNIGYLVKSFLTAYKGKQRKPALILKTCMTGGSIVDRDEILKRLDAVRKSVGGDLPNIYLLHGDLTDSQINSLYNHPKVKALVSFTKGEGYGRPLAEFTQSKKLVIVSGWSGHLDFLNPEFTYLLPGGLHQLHPTSQVKNMLLAESSWFQPDEHAVAQMWKDVYNNYNSFEVAGKRQGYKIKSEFSFEAMQKLLGQIIDTKFIRNVPIRLPKLERID